MYKKLFQLSNLSNQQICNRLGFDHTRRKHYENARLIDVEKFILFSKLLGVCESDVIELVVSEIREIHKQPISF